MTSERRCSGNHIKKYQPDELYPFTGLILYPDLLSGIYSQIATGLSL